jgi:hypothetical protein
MTDTGKILAAITSVSEDQAEALAKALSKDVVGILRPMLEEILRKADVLTEQIDEHTEILARRVTEQLVSQFPLPGALSRDLGMGSAGDTSQGERA